MNKKVTSTLTLTLCAVIWGTALVAQRAGMEDIEPFYYSATRMLIGAFALVLISSLTEKAQNANRKRKGLPAISPDQQITERKIILKGGSACGVIIFFAANTQQIGLVSTGAGKTAFITTLYIVIVPLLALFLKQIPNLYNWIGVAFATVGLYFLCITESLTIARGDLIILIGALFWALHILFMGHYAPQVNVAKLVCVQFFIAGFMSLVVALIIETFAWKSFMAALPGILYVGIVSTAVAFTLQALGQKNANPTVASIILSTESFFGAVSGYLILGEALTSREILGCVLMFIAIIVAQLPTKAERPAMRKER